MVLTVVISFLLLYGTGSLAQSCTQPLSELRQTIGGAFGTDYDVSINCMSFDSNGTLYRAIASGFSDSNPNVRYVFSCTGGVIIAVQSNESVSTVQNGTCVHCEDTPQPCITCKLCPVLQVSPRIHLGQLKLVYIVHKPDPLTLKGKATYTSCVPPHCTVQSNHVPVFCHMTQYITV